MTRGVEGNDRCFTLSPRLMMETSKHLGVNMRNPAGSTALGWHRFNMRMRVWQLLRMLQWISIERRLNRMKMSRITAGGFFSCLDGMLFNGLSLWMGSHKDLRINVWFIRNVKVGYLSTAGGSKWNCSKKVYKQVYQTFQSSFWWLILSEMLRLFRLFSSRRKPFYFI